MKDIIEFWQKEWAVIKPALGTHLAVAAIAAIVIVASGWWFYGEALSYYRDQAEMWEERAAAAPRATTAAPAVASSSPIGQQLQDADATFRRDLLNFLEVAAAPASEAMEDVMNEILMLNSDELASRAFRDVSNEHRRTLADLLNLLRSTQSTPSEPQVVEEFCYYLGRYREGLRWHNWVGDRNAYRFDSVRYKEWVDYNVKFMDDLRDLVRDARFTRLRQSCANEDFMRPIRRADGR